MTSDDLEAELEAACLGLPVVDARLRLVRAGVPLEALRGPFPVGYTTIEPAGDTYQPCPAGRPAYIIPEPVNVSDDWADTRWRILDLVAVTANPLAIYTRRDLTWCLGRCNLERAVYSREPLPVYRSPFRWLRSRRQGIVVINPDELGTRLSWLDAIVGQDLEHARQLRSQIQPIAVPVPKVLVPELEAHAHA